MTDLWIEVDLDGVKHNYRQITSRLRQGCIVMAVVKADGYGLGSVEVARALQEEGCNTFAVTTVSEALILREEGVLGSILVLGPSSPEEWKEAIAKGIELTVSQLNWIQILEDVAADTCKQAKIHLKLETGMGRTGFKEDQLKELASLIQQTTKIEIIGAYSHFARAAQQDHAYTKAQYQKYHTYIHNLEVLGIEIPLKHICNSAAFLDFPEYHHDMVRIGTLLGGHFPSPAFRSRLDLKDPWTSKARIVHLQKAGKGTHAGYQGLYKSKRDTVLAVVPVGYADGFGIEPKFVPQGIIDLLKIIIKNIALLLGYQLGREKLLWNGKAISIAGKIGMQLTILDIGENPCKVGDEIIVPLRRTLANARIPRLYKKNNVFFRKRIMKEGFLSLNTEYCKSH